MECEASPEEVCELYRRHRVRALRIARRILRDPEEAEDVVQDVFIRLWHTPARFDGRAAYTTWLFRIMVNSSINNLRSRRRRARLWHEPFPSTDPEQAAIGRELRQRFEAALGEVPSRYAQVVRLHELRGKSYLEIASLLRMPEGSVKSALNRGRTRVQALLAAEGLSP